MRIFTVGNSFSDNATTFLAQLAAASGHELTLGRAQIGGCPLQKHWDLTELARLNPGDPEARPYDGHSLQELLEGEPWDLITMQQASVDSPNAASYQPYAGQLQGFIRALQPAARLAWHQTWAYREDCTEFGFIAPGRRARDQREMWESSRAAYHAIACEMEAPLIPVGDAFWAVNSDPATRYRPDSEYDFANPAYPHLPRQENSLHVGYSWNTGDPAAPTLDFDPRHASDAGCYLGSLVWYGFLFGPSSDGPSFVPPSIDSATAAHLHRIANNALAGLEPARK